MATRVAAAAMLGALLCVQTAPPACAHAFLERAIPPVGAELADPPATVRLLFTEPVETSFSSIRVQDASGTQIDRGDLHVAPDDAMTLVVSLPKLPAGTYTVVWHVTSVDTHKTEGRFQFTVAH